MKGAKSNFGGLGSIQAYGYMRPKKTPWAPRRDCPKICVLLPFIEASPEINHKVAAIKSIHLPKRLACCEKCSASCNLEANALTWYQRRHERWIQWSNKQKQICWWASIVPLYHWILSIKASKNPGRDESVRFHELWVVWGYCTDGDNLISQSQAPTNLTI